MKIVLLLLAAYFLGGIPWAYLIAKWTRGIDIRQYGSGNVGFTNALRTIGKGPAVLVLIGDIGKGILAVLLAKYFGNPTIATLSGLMVVVGHNYPLVLGFRGGKGAAAGFGALLALLPFEALLAVLVWGITVFFTRYVSLGTILGAFTVPIATLILQEDINYIAFGVLGAAFVILKHHSNISRLFKGTERKIGEKK
ncbi:glycerol-3-phosphate 1-O-acyltransferase PlsY [Candidatus Formimonas warabiya]|uniref:Glycerol-3-phosphate acyltransferase n=1 Tax=Formimonas warabiya TaxID=1761012 RepID=A0A3G1KNQ3_FORW1|nr:glycerol-3-phosphate 1-O-acyltransferase PlsY [Candidatus Formimonas warabiya]ATW24111.1 acyl-phosphate glycerol 3-phosphate acyltransferase [Candidatus Formimonas warabiya]